MSTRPTAPAPEPLSDAQIVEAVHQRQQQRPEGLRKGVLVLLGFVLFAVVGLIPFSLDYFCLLAVAVIVHDLGHLLAMKRSGCADSGLFVLRFFNRWVNDMPSAKDPAVCLRLALAGPLVGTLGIYLAMCLAPWIGYAGALWFVWASCLFNLYNVLPVKPLDGGRVLQYTLVGRHPLLDLSGKYLVVAALLYASVASGYWFIALIGFFLFLSSVFTQPVVNISHRLRGEPGFGEGELTAEKVARIRKEIRTLSPALEKGRNAGDQAGTIIKVWEGAKQRYAPAGLSAAALAIYLLLIGLLGHAYYRIILGG
ncbi:hypothetical protein H5P28_05240 [Ruficoccus amylovorans]|uniref:Uncharacterized protein n=1 Tax=Ruficoccus amylovorans TaxID=1804625 RepID=A0A842HB63_9BACT|nr:hypothetical protein [Ruficoccus amylovorans]MBC2593662.1 hypothetical protein [Ruficoccus amylovorans]